MHTKIIALLLLTVTISCKQSNPAAETKEDLEKIARSKIKVMNDHDLDALGKFYADSAKIASTGYPNVETGPAGARGVYSRYFATSPDLRYEITNLNIGEHSVFIEYTSSGTMQNLEVNVPDYWRGKKYTLKNCTRIDIKDGQVIREMTYFDGVSFLQQMGFFDRR